MNRERQKALDSMLGRALALDELEYSVAVFREAIQSTQEWKRFDRMRGVVAERLLELIPNRGGR